MQNKQLPGKTEVLLDRILRSTKCDKKHCEVCMNVCQLSKFTSSATKDHNVTGETHKTNHKLICDDTCFIYRFSFKAKLRTFCEERYVQRCLFNYFNSMGNNDFLKHIPITLFIIADGKAPKKKTDYWRRNFKTCSPFGLDAEDSASPFSYSSKWHI